MPIKFLPLGGVLGFLEGGGGLPILFLWAWGFFQKKRLETDSLGGGVGGGGGVSPGGGLWLKNNITKHQNRLFFFWRSLILS